VFDISCARQPTAPRRFASTRTKPLSESTTASLTAAGEVAGASW
jgi:hypothetical protein